MYVNNNKRRKVLLALLTLIFVIVQLSLFNHIYSNTFYMMYNSTEVDFRVHALLQNPVYKNFNITRQKIEKVNLLTIVSSAPMHYKRRNAIRLTWWNQCNDNKDTKVSSRCIFMTDRINATNKYYNNVQKENKHQDMYFQNIDGGVQFGVRYIYQILYAVINFEFDYLLRVDDDYFLCFNKLLAQLPLPAQRNFHWGWVHNTSPGLIRADESIIMFSKDIILKFVNQNYTAMQCHPFADQMIAIWMNDLSINNVLRHDSRLHHHPPVTKDIKFRNMKNICNLYIGVHGTYHLDMELLWHNSGNKTRNTVPLLRKSNVTLASLSSVIRHSKTSFHWNFFEKMWSFEPKLCVNDPSWNLNNFHLINGAYSGRETSIG